LILEISQESEVDEDFILYVGFWSGGKNRIVEEYEATVS
jgi:hypothetical protein